MQSVKNMLRNIVLFKNNKLSQIRIKNLKNKGNITVNSPLNANLKTKLNFKYLR